MSDVCPHCLGSGFRLQTDEHGVVRGAICDCGIRERGTSLLHAARIPRRYDDRSFENFDCLNDSLSRGRRIAEEWTGRWPDVESGLLFHGPPGTGKTHLAVAIVRELSEKKGAKALFYEQREMLKELQATFDERSRRTESEVLEPILTADVLVIDDVGAARITAWGHEVMHDIIAHRYNSQLPLILTTNLSLEEAAPAKGKSRQAERLTLQDRLGDALMSRLHEMCRIVRIHSDDFRQKIRHAEFRRNL